MRGDRREKELDGNKSNFVQYLYRRANRRFGGDLDSFLLRLCLGLLFLCVGFYCSGVFYSEYTSANTHSITDISNYAPQGDNPYPTSTLYFFFRISDQHRPNTKRDIKEWSLFEISRCEPMDTEHSFDFNTRYLYTTKRGKKVECYYANCDTDNHGIIENVLIQDLVSRFYIFTYPTIGIINSNNPNEFIPYLKLGVDAESIEAFVEQHAAAFR